LKTRCSIGYAISENPDAKRLNLPQTVAPAQTANLWKTSVLILPLMGFEEEVFEPDASFLSVAAKSDRAPEAGLPLIPRYRMKHKFEGPAVGNPGNGSNMMSAAYLISFS